MHTSCCWAWCVDTITLKRNLLQQLLHTPCQQKCKYNAIMRNTSMFLIIEWILGEHCHFLSISGWRPHSLETPGRSGGRSWEEVHFNFICFLASAVWHNSGWHHVGSFSMLNTTSHQTLPLSSFSRCVLEMSVVCLYSNDSQYPVTALAAWPCMCIYAGCFWLAQSQWDDYHISASSDLWRVV